jgi:anti-sigma factor RsiW
MTHLVTREDPLRLVHAYLDGELDSVNALALETRMAQDPQLAGEFARLEALQQAIRAALPREAPPPGLRAGIEAAVGLARPHGKFPWQFSWRALAAAVAATAVVASASTATILASGHTDRVRAAVVAGHMRALMAPQPFDLASADPHAVKPWFSGKLANAPHVVDLAGAGFPLLGGRLDVVDAAAVPTLVYGDRKHLISVTAVPVSAGQALAPIQSMVGGYNVTRWIEHGECYWVVSDAAAPELERFAALFRAAEAQ